MKCPYCDKEAIWCENKEIYGKNYGDSYMTWLCKPCDAYVGCHKNTKKSLGPLADYELRQLRKSCHRLFDQLWEKRHIYKTRLKRAQAYELLKKKTGVRHIAWATKGECRTIMNWLKQKKQIKLI